MRVRGIALAVLACCLAAAAAGCGPSGGASKNSYSAADIKAAYYRAKDTGASRTVQSYFVNDDFHSHTNFVPPSGVETCPLAQRANADRVTDNMIEPTAAEPVGQFVVEPTRDTDLRTPTITQGALVFGTSTIAGSGMEAVGASIAKCPTTYEVRGGPAPILGTYSVTSRPYDASGWKGYAQQIAHTFPPGQDNVYYEDSVHIVLHRANVILYVDLLHRKVIGERSDSSAKAEAVLKTVLQRLG